MVRLYWLWGLLLIGGCAVTPTPTATTPPPSPATIAANPTPVTPPASIPATPVPTGPAAPTVAAPTGTIGPAPTSPAGAIASGPATVAPAAALATAGPLGSVGQRLASDGFAVTVQAVTDPTPPVGDFRPRDGYRWVSIDLTIENTGREPLPFHPFYAKLRTGPQREQGPTLGMLHPALGGGLQAPGQVARGWLTFEVPLDAQPRALIYDPHFDHRQTVITLP